MIHKTWLGLGLVAMCLGFAGGAAESAQAAVPALTGLSASSSYGNAGNVPLGNALTLEAWIYPTGWRSYSGREKHGLNFMVKGLLGSHWDYVFCLQENGILCLGNTSGYLGVMNQRISLNRWTHVAVTVDNNTGDLRFYINGVYAGAGSGWQGRNPARKGFLSASGHALNIGGFNQRGWGYNNDNFLGKMADVRVWNVVRSAADIAACKDRQLTGKEAGLQAYWTFVGGAADKTGHGYNLSLGGSAACTAEAGPELEAAGGITAAMRSPANGGNGRVGAVVALDAGGVNSSGTISAVTFYVNGRSMAGQVNNNGTNWSATAQWTPLAAGSYSIYAVATNATSGMAGRTATISFAVPGPFVPGGIPVPGSWIEAEHFDVFGYSDTTAGNAGGVFRPNESVDITTASGTNYLVGWTPSGEWMDYTLNVQSAGQYRVGALVAAKGTGGRFTVSMNQTMQTVAVPDTGSWSASAWVWTDDAFLCPTAGVYVMRVMMTQAGTGGNVAAFDRFALGELVRGPYHEEMFVLPSAVAASGILEAENFDEGGAAKGAYHDTTPGNTGNSYRTGDVDISTTNGVTVVGWNPVGEWMEYTVRVPVSGMYAWSIRAGSPSGGGKYNLLLDGATRLAGQSVPATGAWTTYAWTAETNVHFTVGVHTMRVAVAVADASGNFAAVDSYRFRLLSKDQSAYPAGVAHAVPGTIQAEDFDLGGADTAYADTTVGNAGGKYRTGENVDISAGGSGFVIGWTPAGEWLEYTLQVPEAGSYVFRADVAASGTGGKFRVLVDETNATEWLTVPNTGSWNTFVPVDSLVQLSSGIHTMRVALATAGTGANVAAIDAFHLLEPLLTLSPATTNLGCGSSIGNRLAVTANVSWTAVSDAAWLSVASGASGAGNGAVLFTAAANTATNARTAHITVTGGGISQTCTVTQVAQSRPFNGLAMAVPGVIQVENFDNGGEGIAYHDTTAGNAGGRYRTGENVDISTDSSCSGYCIGWTPAGEWLEYSVNVATAGTYRLQARLAAKGTGGKFRVLVDGVNASGDVSVPNTGSWSVYQTVAAPQMLNLSAGDHILRLVMVTVGTGGNVAAFDSLTLASATPYGGVARAVPGVVEVEDFDEGGEGLAYHDTTPGNAGGKYRTGENVDISTDSVCSGFCIGWTPASEWLGYTIHVTTSGVYTVAVRLAGNGTGGEFQLQAGTNMSSVVSVPNTGAWNVYGTVSASLYLEAGTQQVRLRMTKISTGGHVAAFDKMTFALASPAPHGVAAPRAMGADKAELDSILPVAVLSDDGDEVAAAAAADGDGESIWCGLPQKDGWWLALTYEPPMDMQSLSIETEAVSAADVRVLTSADALTWAEPFLTGFEDALPVEAVRYLWLIFTDPDGIPPAIREVVITPPADEIP